MPDGSWRIPLSDLDLGQAEEDAVLRVIRSGWLTIGGEVSAFEREFAALCGVDDAVCLSNCTAALHLACVAMRVDGESEVIVPSMTFVATANAVVLAGGRPVFADSVGGEDFSIDPADVERRITPRTKGLICVHYGGSACRMDELVEICRRHRLFMIEDVAHAPGAHWHGQALGTIGDIGCFSFFGNKNLTTGEGGMAIARDPAVLARVRRLRSHGMTTTSWDRFRGRAYDYDVVESGLNYRPNELAAAVGRAQLAQLQDRNRRRNALLELYRAGLDDVPGLRLTSHDPEGAAHLAVVVAESEALRDELREALKRASIQSSLHYPPAHLFAHFRETFGYAEGDLPVAEELARCALTLPLYAHLEPAEVDEVCQVLRATASGAVAEAFRGTEHRFRIEQP